MEADQLTVLQVSSRLCSRYMEPSASMDMAKWPNATRSSYGTLGRNAIVVPRRKEEGHHSVKYERITQIIQGPWRDQTSEYTRLKTLMVFIALYA